MLCVYCYCYWCCCGALQARGVLKWKNSSEDSHPIWSGLANTNSDISTLLRELYQASKV